MAPFLLPLRRCKWTPESKDAPTSTAPSAGNPSAQKSDYATTKNDA